MQPWEMIIHGDAEAAVRDIVENLTPELPGTVVVSTNMVGYVSGQKRVVVIQEGSMRRWPKIDRPRIDVESYADNRTTAKAIAEIALASIERAKGSYVGFGLTITDVVLEQGVTRVDDKLQEGVRYIFSVRLTTVPRGAYITVPS